MGGFNYQVSFPLFFDQQGRLFRLPVSLDPDSSPIGSVNWVCSVAPSRRPEPFERRWVAGQSSSHYSQSVRLAATSTAQSSGGWPCSSMR